MRNKKVSQKLHEWLEAEAFLGVMLKSTMERFLWSWDRQDKEEQRRRLSLVLELAEDLVRVKHTTSFATDWVEAAIEDIIIGDRSALGIRMTLLKFESPGLRQKYAVLFAPTVEILQRAYDTWPEDPLDGTSSKSSCGVPRA